MSATQAMIIAGDGRRVWIELIGWSLRVVGSHDSTRIISGEPRGAQRSGPTEHGGKPTGSATVTQHLGTLLRDGGRLSLRGLQVASALALVVCARVCFQL